MKTAASIIERQVNFSSIKSHNTFTKMLYDQIVNPPVYELTIQVYLTGWAKLET